MPLKTDELRTQALGPMPTPAELKVTHILSLMKLRYGSRSLVAKLKAFLPVKMIAY